MDGGQPLLERDDALARIDERLREASAGRGSLLVLEGIAGIGKTRLVLAAGRHGRDLGLTTLSARGSELEQDFAYGLVRQLFEAPLIAAAPPERAELLAGAAGHAATLLGLAAVQEDVAGALLDPSFAILHGLYWLCANLGRRSPLLVCVDDVHWADQASLRFLHYLGRRLDELPIAVVAAARPGRFGLQDARLPVLGQPAGTDASGRADVGDDVVGHRFSVLSFCAQVGAAGSVPAPWATTCFCPVGPRILAAIPSAPGDSDGWWATASGARRRPRPDR